MPIQVYILHHEKDEEYLKKLEGFLKVSKRKGILDTWHSQLIIGGHNIEKVIEKRLKSSNVIVVLCSPDLLGDDDTFRYLNHSILLHKEDNKLVIPILVRPCLWDSTGINDLPFLLPQNKQSIVLEEQKNIDEVFLQTTKDLLNILHQEIKTPRSGTNIPIDIQQDTIPINLKVYDMFKGFFRENEVYTQRIFALAYPSSLLFLQHLTDKYYVNSLKAANILREAEQGWQVESVLLEHLRKDFEIDGQQLYQAEKISTNLFKSKEYKEQDLFNIVHLMFLHYTKSSPPKSIENEIITAFLKIRFNKANNDPIAVSKLLNEFITHIGEFSDIDVKERISAMNNFISGLQTLGQYEEALGYLELNLNYCKDYVGKNKTKKKEVLEFLHEDIIKIHQRIGSIYYETGSFVESIESYNKAIGICKFHKGTNNTDLAALYQNVSRPHFKLGSKGQKKAIGLLEDALEICRNQVNANERTKMLAGIIIANSAVVYEAIGDYEKAKEYQYEAISEKEKLMGKNHPSVAMSYHNLGSFFQKMGRYSLALDATQTALDIRQKKLGNEHPHTLTTEYNLVVIYSRLHLYDKAQKIAEKLLAFCKNDRSNSTYYAILDELGNLHIKKKEFNLALEFFEKSLIEKIRFHGETYIAKNTHALNLGNLHYNQSKYDIALEKYTESLNLYSEAVVEENAELAHRYFLVGKTLIKKKNYKGAMQYFEKALAIREKQHSMHPETALVHKKMAEVFRLQKRYKEAISSNEKSLKIYLYNDDIQHISKTLAYLLDGYVQNEEIYDSRFQKHLCMISYIEDEKVLQMGVDTLKKLQSFENVSLNDILHNELKEVKVDAFLKKLGIERQEESSEEEISYF